MQTPRSEGGGVLLIACALPLTMAAQTSDTDKKLLELEKQLDAIKAQIEELKAASHPSAAPSPAPATTAVATPAPAAAAPAPAAAPAKDPLAGITSVLGGVNLTGVVDAYYGYNANHPNLVDNGGTSNEPFTFVNNQFSLNLLELQLDKPVDKVRVWASAPLSSGVRPPMPSTMPAVGTSHQTTHRRPTARRST